MVCWCDASNIGTFFLYLHRYSFILTWSRSSNSKNGQCGCFVYQQHQESPVSATVILFCDGVISPLKHYLSFSPLDRETLWTFRQCCGSASLWWAGPDPYVSFHFNTDQDPSYHCNADPDPDPYKWIESVIIGLLYTHSTASFESPPGWIWS